MWVVVSISETIVGHVSEGHSSIGALGNSTSAYIGRL